MGINRFNGMSILSITWQDITAWMNLTGIKLNKFEVQAVIELDTMHVITLSEEIRDSEARKKGDKEWQKSQN